MKKSELLEKLKLFKEKLEAHKELYEKSFYHDEHLGRFNDHPSKNIKELENQRKELNRLYAILEKYIAKYSIRRIREHPKTGMKWDIYPESIGNSGWQIKCDSLNHAIMDLEGIIAKVEAEAKEEIDILEIKDINKELEERDRKIKELERRLFEISAHRRLGIVIIIFLIIEYAIINLIMRYGAGLNIFQKLVGSLSLPVAVIVLLRYFGYIIIGKERIKALGWLFTKFFKV